MRRSSTIPLVARLDEVAAFRRALERAANGDPGVLLVSGDAGVGKTRLVSHLGEIATDAATRVVVAHCVDLGDVGIPYLPFTEALSRLLDDPAVAAVVEQRPALGRLLDPAEQLSGDHAERLPLLDGVASSLAAAGSADRPLVLVIEDLHWADPSTRDVLRFLVARLRGEHLLLVLTYRSDDVDRRHPLRPLLAELHRSEAVEALDLNPFTAPELREFTSAVHGEPLSEEAFAEILRRSEGNAFFAEELLEAGTSSDGLPWTLTEVLHARLARFDDATQQVIRLASVAGRQVRADLLGAAADRLPALHGAGGTHQALRTAVAHHVLGVEQDRIAFRHALLAEALYLDLLPGERTAMHRAYLDALTDQPDLGSAAARAHHALSAHDLPTALGASYTAAEDAAALLAPAEQLRHLEQVLSLWDSVPDPHLVIAADRGDVGLAAAAAASGAGSVGRAVQLARRAVESLDGAPDRQAHARSLLARYLLEADGYESALQHTDLALAALPPDTPSEALAWVLATRSRVALNLDRDAEARRYGERAVEVARAAEVPDAEADALTTLAVLDVDDPDQAAQHLTAAQERAVAAGDLSTEMRSRFNLAATYFYAGHLVTAQRTIAAGLHRAQAVGLSWGSYGTQLHVLDTIRRYMTGDLSDTDIPEGAPRKAATLIAAAGAPARVAREGGEAIAAVEDLYAQKHVDGQVALHAGSALIDALTWAARYDDAVARASELADQLGTSWPDFLLGRVSVAALGLAALADQAEEARAGTPGDMPERGDRLIAVARDSACQGRPRGGRLGPEGRAWLARAEAEHARLRAALDGAPADPELWETCLREQGYGHLYEQARARFRWAQALRAHGDTSAAEVEATEALRSASAMGARPLIQSITTWGRRARLRLGGNSLRPSSVLTGREEEVLQLVAAGMSNREIGERLYISAKTVSVHVSNVIAKLGVSGRTEAVAVAHRRGLLRI